MFQDLSIIESHQSNQLKLLMDKMNILATNLRRLKTWIIIFKLTLRLLTLYIQKVSQTN